MSEKRFTYGGVSPNVAQISENGKILNIGEICNLLNTLHEENEQLKQENQELKEKLRKIKEITIELKDEELSSDITYERKQGD